MNTKIIGVSGGSASGKTSIVKILKEELGDKAQVIFLDSYYQSFDHLSFEDRTKMNFDHPDSFEADRLVKDLIALKSGQPIEMPIYDYVAYERKKETTRVVPHEVILVEGLLVLYYPELRNLFDLKVYVATDSDERLIRRIKRDTIKRGRTLESVLHQYQTTVKPMHEQFVEPSKQHADIIIPTGARNQRGVSLLLNFARQLVQD